MTDTHDERVKRARKTLISHGALIYGDADVAEYSLDDKPHRIFTNLCIDLLCYCAGKNIDFDYSVDAARWVLAGQPENWGKQ